MSKRRGLWNVGSIATLAAAVVAGSMAQPASAQLEQKQDAGYRSPGDPTGNADYARKGCKASDLIGMNVCGPNGDKTIGSIDDLFIGHDGRITYAVVSFGGFLGFGDKLFAVPFEAIHFTKVDDNAYARIDVTEQTLKEKKGFHQGNWPMEADRTFTRGNLGRQAATPGVSR